MASSKVAPKRIRLYRSKGQIFLVSFLVLLPAFVLGLTAVVLFLFDRSSSSDAVIDGVLALPLFALGLYLLSSILKTEMVFSGEFIRYRKTFKTTTVRVKDIRSILAEQSPSYKNPTAVLKLVISDNTSYNYIEIFGLPASFKIVQPALKELYLITKENKSIKTNQYARILLESAHKDITPKLNLWKLDEL